MFGIQRLGFVPGNREARGRVYYRPDLAHYSGFGGSDAR